MAWKFAHMGHELVRLFSLILQVDSALESIFSHPLETEQHWVPSEPFSSMSPFLVNLGATHNTLNIIGWLVIGML